MKFLMKKTRLGMPDLQMFFDGNDPGGSNPPSRDPIVTIAKYNSDVNAMARHIDKIEGENWQYREDKRKLNERVGELEKSKPAEGTIILTTEQKKAWDEYQALGKPEDIVKQRDENVRLKTEQEKSSRKELMAKVSENPSPGIKFDSEVLADLDSRLLGVRTYEQREVTEEGGKVSKWFVKYTEGEGSGAVAKESPVLEFYTEKFPKYLDSLKADSSPGGGTPYPEQLPGGTSKNPATDPASTYASTRYGHNTGKKP